MKILVVLLSLGCTGAAYADVGPVQGGSTVGDSGTASVAPTWNPGVMDPANGTYIPPGSGVLDNSQARDGIDSLGGFDGTSGALGTDNAPSELQVPGRNSIPSNGGHF
jgi:hypothetical protein